MNEKFSLKKTLLKSGLLLGVLTSLLHGSNIDFPKNYKDEVLYFKNDRGSITEEVFVDKRVIEKVQNNQQIPIGTVITLVEYFAKDKKGADGYALKGDLKRFVVMKKEPINNDTTNSGGWIYQAFNPNGTIKEENLNRCVSCHNSAKNNDFVFTFDDIKNFRLD